MTYNLLKFGHILGAILMGAGVVGHFTRCFVVPMPFP